MNNKYLVFNYPGLSSRLTGNFVWEVPFLAPFLKSENFDRLCCDYDTGLRPSFKPCSEFLTFRLQVSGRENKFFRFVYGLNIRACRLLEARFPVSSLFPCFIDPSPY
jgi:hypothetical protein